MQTSIGRETSTINISNDFELLQDMEDNVKPRPKLKETKNSETSTTKSTGEGGMEGTHLNIPPDE